MRNFALSIETSLKWYFKIYWIDNIGKETIVLVVGRSIEVTFFEGRAICRPLSRFKTHTPFVSASLGRVWSYRYICTGAKVVCIRINTGEKMEKGTCVHQLRLDPCIVVHPYNGTI